MSSYFQEGWEEQNPDDPSHKIDITTKFLARDKPLRILQSTKHSLQPDMLFGWRPKVASCPLPLRFPNTQSSKLVQLVQKSDVYRMAYRNKHFVNSVQVNQRYDYYWKYRSRYSLNLAFIEQTFKEQQQAIKKKHQNSAQMISLKSNYVSLKSNYVQPCEYRFSSDFQSGNLDYAIRVKPNQYDCLLRSDSNTKGHCNWYYFSVRNYGRVGEIKVNICNMGKTKNLYNKGMKPYVRETIYQEQLSDKQREQLWSQQQCYSVEFVERICRYGSECKRSQLQFKYSFPKPNMQVFFAYTIPYTYSRLQTFIKEISSNHQSKSILVVEKLCQSLGGLNLPLLKITNDAQKNQHIQTRKKAVILSARIHPGESHSSFVIEGLIRDLLNNQQQTKILREHFIFYIIPMINVDGVVIGNYRTSFSGKDLNRQFKDLDVVLFPQVTHLHQLALQLRQRHFQGVEFYIDFHGHSSKKNLFTYGPEHNPKNIYYFKSRIFPKLIESIHPIFSYKQSTFNITEGKIKTARAHMLWKLNIPMVYTFEVSNGIYEDRNGKDILLTEKILLQAGHAVFAGFSKYVKLQMKIPATLLDKKVNFILSNKQNIKRRLIKSSKGIRDSSIGVGKIRVSKRNQLIGKNFLSEKFLLINEGKGILSTRRQLGGQEMQRQQDGVDQETMESLDQFMGLVEEVKNSKNNVDLQGGSDSESQGEDMDKEDQEKLFRGIKSHQYDNIKSRKLIKQLKRSKKPSHRYSRQQKLNSKKVPPSDQNTNIFIQIKKQLSKCKNSELEQIIKESHKLNSQMSYINLSVNKINHTLVKSPSVGDSISRLSGKLYNAVANAKDNLHVEKQKLVKAVLVQRQFDLEISR